MRTARTGAPLSGPMLELLNQHLAHGDALPRSLATSHDRVRTSWLGAAANVSVSPGGRERLGGRQRLPGR